MWIVKKEGKNNKNPAITFAPLNHGFIVLINSILFVSGFN